MHYNTINDILKYFNLKSMCNQYESQSETTNNIGTFRPTTKTAAKDPHEKEDYISRGSTRWLTEGKKKQYWSLQNNDKQDCSKGEQLEMESNGD